MASASQPQHLVYFAAKYPQDLGFEVKVTKVQDSASKRWTGQQTRQFEKHNQECQGRDDRKGRRWGEFSPEILNEVRVCSGHGRPRFSASEKSRKDVIRADAQVNGNENAVVESIILDQSPPRRMPQS